ncbi:MAG: DoxX family protein [Deltaproteobacteria bacterium]|nr:DoxX family protein [Deltaproteobacteria bacterium]
MNERSKRVLGWVATALVGFAFAAGGLADLLGADAVMVGMRHLGYPDYFALILGTWKVLGAVTIVAPGMRRLKEWAYAGMVFDLTGAIASHAAAGDALPQLATPAVLLGLVAVSWALRPASRRLAG